MTQSICICRKVDQKLYLYPCRICMSSKFGHRDRKLEKKETEKAEQMDQVNIHVSKHTIDRRWSLEGMTALVSLVELKASG